MTNVPVLAKSTPQWFAAQVWAGRERLCERHLSVRGYEVFLPCYRERRRWSDRLKTMERALFPGYVFCRLSDEAVGKIVTTPGLIRIVGDGRVPAPVAPEEIHALQRVVAMRFAAEPWEYLQAGQRVRIVDGPLRDCEGTVIRANDRHRLIISITLLQRSVAVEVDPSWVEANQHVWAASVAN
jgi:transcription antitermination factor NusG